MQISTLDLGLRVVTLGLTSVTILFLFLLLTALRRAGELQKARLFLHFNRLHRIHIGGIRIAMVGILLNLAYMSVDRRIFQMDYFMQSPFGFFAIAIHVAFVVLAICIIRIFKSGATQAR
ncbi:MAG: hypothetical protein HY558_03250 [Euryarchaeota archaeon]|nr:hypothetical protein [Euryarchaeota archaeon]